MQIQQTSYDKFVLVNLAFSAYSGLVTLDKNSMGNNIDPKLISAGEIKTVSRDHLKVFGTLKAKARSRCLRYGTSFMGGYAIPVNKWDEVQNELNHVKTEYEQEATYFISNYNKLVIDWADEHPKDRQLIIDKAHSLEWIKGRFGTEFFGCTLSPASGMDETMNKHVDGMFDNVCKDIATDAKQAIRAYQKGSKITSKMKATFEGMIEKIEALSFVNSSLKPIAETIKQYIDGLFVGKGKIDDDRQSKIAIILVAMSDAENLPNLANILNDETNKVASFNNSSQIVDSDMNIDESESINIDEFINVTEPTKDYNDTNYNPGFSLL